METLSRETPHGGARSGGQGRKSGTADFGAKFENFNYDAKMAVSGRFERFWGCLWQKLEKAWFG